MGSRTPRSLLSIAHALFWARTFARLAGPGRVPGDRREVHEELAALYTELADAWQRRGAVDRVRGARARASLHRRLAGPPDAPPAVAVGMPVPRPPIRTDARAAAARHTPWQA